MLAAEFAQQHGITVVGFLGKNGGKLKNYCNHKIIVPSNDTARIQEMHILIGHIICAYIDFQFSEK